ncbi:MAG: hypothetical protein HXS52_07930 [Theionarchaea archaeon]|nr:hypothetical protein [Theionarchaea archaeon]
MQCHKGSSAEIIEAVLQQNITGSIIQVIITGKLLLSFELSKGEFQELDEEPGALALAPLKGRNPLRVEDILV